MQNHLVIIHFISSYSQMDGAGSAHCQRPETWSRTGDQHPGVRVPGPEAGGPDRASDSAPRRHIPKITSPPQSPIPPGIFLLIAPVQPRSRMLPEWTADDGLEIRGPASRDTLLLSVSKVDLLKNICSLSLSLHHRGAVFFLRSNRSNLKARASTAERARTIEPWLSSVLRGNERSEG